MSRVRDMSARTVLPTVVSWRRVDRWPNQLVADTWDKMFPFVVETPMLEPNEQRERMEEFCKEHFGKYGVNWAIYATTRMLDDHTKMAIIVTVGFNNEADLSYFLIGFDRS